jgi:RNA-directed DNA polymerase
VSKFNWAGLSAIIDNYLNVQQDTLETSGSFIPPPVWLVEIEKNGGGTWRGADGGKDVEPRVEPIFHLDSYGYHPGRSEFDAIGVARKRCWEFERIIDLDIKAFFDSIPHDLIEKAVVHHTDLAWVQLYVGVAACPIERPNGTLETN